MNTRFFVKTRLHRHRMKEYPLQIRHRQDWDQGLFFLLPGSDAGSDGVSTSITGNRNYLELPSASIDHALFSEETLN